MENETLSKEQHKQIEEKRKRALARLQQCCIAQPVQYPLETTSSTALSQLSVVSTANGATPSSVCIRSFGASAAKGSNSNKGSEQCFPVSNSGTRSPSSKDQGRGFEAWHSKTNKNVAKIGADHIKDQLASKKQFYGISGQTVRGHCVLVSRSRFEVAVGFSAPLVEIFKTVNSRLYDSKSRQWQFSLEDHDGLMRAVATLRPQVEIEPLHRAILKTFGSRKNQGKDSIPQADLSNVDPVLLGSLMPFQKESVNFGVYQKGRVLIADDMGLGKTLQAICLACIYRHKWPLLIVTPSSVRFDWAQQFKRWVPSVDSSEVQVVVRGQDDPTVSLVSIISYDLLSRKAKLLAKASYKIIIMDESHFLKNSKTARTKAALPLLQKAEHVILLSGTPALSRPAELFTQIVAVCPHLFKFHDFGVRYCAAKQHQWGWDYSGCSNLAELQLLLEEKVMIRHLKQEVLDQLPEKRRQMVVLDPASVSSSRSLLQASFAMEKSLSSAQSRGVLIQYFHETCKVKISAVRDYITDMLAGEKKFIIFAHHQEMMDGIEDVISREGVGYIRIDGRTTAEQRNFFSQKFQNDDKCRTAVLSIMAANAGLNLSAASVVIFAELFWNPGTLAQAEDRAHRIGQKDSVMVYYLVAQKTADDYIWPLVQSKLQVLGRVGLARDDFSQADTAHMQDPKQRLLLDMFKESFLVMSTSMSESPQNQNGGQDYECQDEDSSTPRKRIRTDGKRQTGLSDFFESAGRGDANISATKCRHLEQDLQAETGQYKDSTKIFDGTPCDLNKGTAADDNFDSLAADINWDDDFS